jgi:hypothetical protein
MRVAMDIFFIPYISSSIYILMEKLPEYPYHILHDHDTKHHTGGRARRPPRAAPTFGALNFPVAREERDWPAELVTRLKLVALAFATTLARETWCGALVHSRDKRDAALVQRGSIQ